MLATVRLKPSSLIFPVIARFQRRSRYHRQHEMARVIGIVIEGVGCAQMAEIELALLIERGELNTDAVAFPEYPAGGPDLDLERVYLTRLERLDFGVRVIRARRRRA